MTENWVSTGDAMRMLNLGIHVKTFREKFRDFIPCRKTPGGHLRWNAAAILALVDKEKPA